MQRRDATTRGDRCGRRSTALAFALAALAVLAACGDSGRDTQREATIPRVTPASTTTTVAPPPTPFVPTTAPTTTTTTITLPQPPPPPPQTLPSNVTPPVTTSIVVVTTGTEHECTSEAIAADTGISVGALSCWGGFALGVVDDGAQVFHVTTVGWVDDGVLEGCAQLVEFGMTAATAARFDPHCDDYHADPTERSVIRPDSAGDEVRALQIALVAEGYELADDGVYGPRTQAAVRDFQRRSGLEVDGIAGPETQLALDIGPFPGDGSEPTTTVPAGSVTPSTVVLTPADAPECTAQAITSDTGVSLIIVQACQSGWAIGSTTECPRAGCEEVDVFHVTDAGWVHDGVHGAACAEDLVAAGMSVYTAQELATFCGDAPPDDREIIRPGAEGEVVELLQIALVAQGYPIAVDGIYGPRTQASVGDFQSRNDLEVDGIAGPMTRGALGV